jgi:hypothetical protein
LKNLGRMLLRALSEQQTSVHQAVECRVEFDLLLVHHCSQLLRTCKNVTQLGIYNKPAKGAFRLFDQCFFRRK